jgi:DNA gyrase/topoisomerase IV subunit B
MGANEIGERIICALAVIHADYMLGSLTGLTKLADANNAGTKKAGDCTLILTEGDSAKSLAVAGLGVVGRDNFGVFPLRGKLLNVREAKHDQIMKNEEIQNIKKILGLQHNKDYSNTSSLRYGQLMIMTDQVDGFSFDRTRLALTPNMPRTMMARTSRDSSSTF